MRRTIDKEPRGVAHRSVSPFATPLGRGASLIDGQASSITVPGSLEKRAP